MDRIFRNLDICTDSFDWSLVLLVEDLLVHDWKDNATHMIHRSARPEKIGYIPQVKSVMNQLSVLEGEAREAYMERQRRMVLETLDVQSQTITFGCVPLIVLPLLVYQKIQRLGDEAPS